MTKFTKTLHANWTIHTYPDIDALSDEINKIIQAEIDREILEQVKIIELIKQGWICVSYNSKHHITPEWCKTYIKGDYYQSLNHKFYFKEELDSVYFTLKWSN